MIVLSKKFLYVILIVACPIICMGSVFAEGPKIDKDNPFLDATDAGGAEYIDVVGADGASGAGQEDALINVIKGGVNWVLGILALIALLVLLWGGFLMVTAAGNEERYNKGWTILKQAAIGLVLIGVAWFIISLIFWLINLTATGVGSADTQN